MAKKKAAAKQAEIEQLPPAETLTDAEHPDYADGIVGEATADADDEAETSVDEFTPIPGQPLPRIPFPRVPLPRPLPVPLPFPAFCYAVSGRYRYRPPIFIQPAPLQPTPILPMRPAVPRPVPGPLVPINLLSITVRVDVDRYFPQKRISIEVSRLFPRSSAHVIAQVTSDHCWSHNNRTITANITYRDGNASLIQGSTVTFKAQRTTGFGYGKYTLQLSGGGAPTRTYALSFESRYFDAVEFEVDRAANSGAIVTSYNTGSHPNKPSNLPNETLSLATVYQRAGFDVSMSPNSTVIPLSGAGANGTWSDAEMHNAMVTYWSRFANRPQWAMWVFYAARHDSGRSLGGVMFDDIGPNHRQGTAIFTDSFIQDAPATDPNKPAWRKRMQFWTAIHEMGHAFNLAHAWQKALGVPQGAPGDPWIPLANEPESRSFMNYPFRVSGGQAAFFSDFRFQFSPDELIFMRHAPRRFVQMGNSNWFVNHGFEAPDALRHTGNWALEIRPNREANAYSFLEPVTMELKLTNTSDEAATVNEDLLSDGRHVVVFLQREAGATREWRPMITRCHELSETSLDPNESIYGAHMISASTEGWMIDEPGFYKVQAAVDMGHEIVVSNVMRLFVGPPTSNDEAALAPDYFTENVGRVLAFSGAPELAKANGVLDDVVKKCKTNPAAKHAQLALTSPDLRSFKLLDADSGREKLEIRAQKPEVAKAAKAQTDALLGEPNAAADTVGHIPYFEQLRGVAEAMEDSGDKAGAVKVMRQTIDVMKKREILASIIRNAEARLKTLA